MVLKRIVPCLDVKNGRVVKGIHFQELRDGGDPVELAGRYYRDGADELVFLDITAGLERRRTVLPLVEQTAREVFIPLTVGGGIRSIEDARDLLLAGCDKVAVNSAAVRRPILLEELAGRFGQQCVVLAVDVIPVDGRFRVVIDAGRTVTELYLEDWLMQAQALGAGEVLLTSIATDGVRNGYDLGSIAAAAAHCRVPLVASGGLGSADHILEACRAGADAVLAASVFHYGTWTVRSLKERLRKEGLEVRL